MAKKTRTQKTRTSPQSKAQSSAPAAPHTGPADGDAKDGEELLSMEQAIAALRTTRPTFYRWLRGGRLKGMKVGRQWRFYREDLDRFLQGQGPRIDLPADIGPFVQQIAQRLKALGRNLPPAVREDKLSAAASALVELAVAMNASDIHVDPRSDASHASIRLRVDGALHEVAALDLRLLPALVQQFKSLGGCDIQEKTLPQDGRMVFQSGKESIDLRLSFLPTVSGESVVMRVLRAGTVVLDLNRLDYSPADRQRIDRVLGAAWGVFIVTGPTGCGKTTTLYCSLLRLARPQQKVLSIEDPVEYFLPGVTQVQTNEKSGMTFSRAIRASLRSDPDVLLVGEIRSPEVLGLCFQTALTGHLVLTTLHAENTVAALQRMTDMGAEPFLVGDATKLLLSQRLVRKLCPACSVAAAPPTELLERAERHARDGGLDWGSLPKAFRKPVGCPQCGKLGFRGRRVIAETLEMSPPLAAALRRRAGLDELHRLAVGGGMTTMAADGIRRAAAGEVSLEEVLGMASAGL